MNLNTKPRFDYFDLALVSTSAIRSNQASYEDNEMKMFHIGAIAFLSACAFAGYATAGHAEEQKTLTRTVTVYTLSDNPELAKKVEAICGDKSVVLSVKARKACDDKAFPPLTKAKEFRASGIGGEFNALARQRTTENKS